MRTKTASAALILGLFLAGEAWAQAETYGARARRWRAQVDGDFQADSSFLGGTNFDLRDTADLDGEADINDFGVTFGFPGIGKLNLQYWRGGFEGDSTLGQDLAFDGVTIPGGTAIKTSLDWSVGSILVEYSSRGPGIFAGNAFAFQTGLKYLDVRGKIESAAGGEEALVRGYLPALGIHGRITTGQYLAVEIEANGLLIESFEIGGLTGLFYDVAISGQFSLSGFYAGAGYRWFHVEAEDERGGDTTKVDAMIDGFFFEVGLKM